MAIAKVTSFGKIGVLMGGPSSEREISLKSGLAVYGALKDLGCDVVAIDVVTDSVEENIKLIKSHGINCAFIALHGYFGEDGQIQKLLEDMNLAYTGPGPKASCLAMDKIESRRIFEANGLNVPRYKVFFSDNPSGIRKDIGMSLPLVVKPVSAGSSIGLSIIDKMGDLSGALDLAFKYDKRVIVEEYIAGREVTVGILGEVSLPVVEVIPKNRFFDFEAKYQSGLTDYIVPAKIDKDATCLIKDAAEKAYHLLGCCGCSRVDLILDGKNKAYVLEVNTIPGLTQTSLLPKAARCLGMDFGELCIKLIELAYEKTKHGTK